MTNKPTATEDTSMATPAKWEEEFALDIFDMGSYTTIENEELLSYIKQNFHHKSESGIIEYGILNETGIEELPEELTLKQVCDELGRDIKIVK